jgi:uncharacterized membrane protein
MESGSISPLMLTIMFWLHMLATVAWIGGLTAVSFLVLPAARKSLDNAAFSLMLAHIQTRLQQIGWFSLAVLGLTGMFQMSASPAYQGFLAIGNAWSLAILSKHLVIGGMVLVSGYMTWGLLPSLRRNALLRSAGKTVDADLDRRLQRREAWMLRINLLLAAVVLLLTAWARAVI